MARPRVLAGLVVSAGLLALLAWVVPTGEVFAVLAGVRAGPALAALGAHAAMLLLRVGRYQIIVEERPTLGGFVACGEAVFVGWLANLALPVKLGELARPAVLARRIGRPVEEVLGTVATERVLDLLALGAGFWLAFAALPGAEGLPSWFERVALAGGVASGLGVVGLVALRRLGPRGTDGSALRRTAARFRDGLALFDAPRRLAAAVAATGLVWAAEATVTVLTLRACGLADPFALESFAGATARSVVATLAVALPAAPGGVGVDQWASVLALRPFGVPDAVATAGSLLDLAIAVALVAPVGVVALARVGGRRALSPPGTP